MYGGSSLFIYVILFFEGGWYSVSFAKAGRNNKIHPFYDTNARLGSRVYAEPQLQKKMASSHTPRRRKYEVQ